MSEPEERWDQEINEAIRKAKAEGRSDVAEYISLKSSNDAIRRNCIDWLFETVLDVTAAFNERGVRIDIEKKENYSFDHEKANLTGSFLKLQQGVRCLTFEAGWTRKPGDGFMRGGALAFARIRHFGFPNQSEDLALIRFEDVPQWFIVADERNRISFDIDKLRRHFKVFLAFD